MTVREFEMAVRRLDAGQAEVVGRFLAGRAGPVSAAELVGGSCAEVDAELMYPTKGQPVKPAQRVCRGCEVRESCLEYALLNDERFGVWGGMSGRDREVLVIEFRRRHGIAEPVEQSA